MRNRDRRVVGLALGLTLVALPSAARAQFPVFNGGQVLTPFGNRGSDGSYAYRYQAPRRVVTNRAYVAEPAPAYVPNGRVVYPNGNSIVANPSRRPFWRRWR